MLSPRGGGNFMSNATFGAGGYSRAISTPPETRIIGIDRDRSAIAGRIRSRPIDRTAGSPWVEDNFCESRRDLRRSGN